MALDTGQPEFQPNWSSQLIVGAISVAVVGFSVWWLSVPDVSAREVRSALAQHGAQCEVKTMIPMTNEASSDSVVAVQCEGNKIYSVTRSPDGAYSVAELRPGTRP